MYGQNCVGNGSARSASITGIPSHSNALSGHGFVCPGTNGVVYSMGSVNGTSTYSWSITGNASIVNSNGTSCTVNFLPNWTSGILTITTSNSCGSFTKSFTIQSTPAQPGSISGPASNLCGMSGVTYSIAAVAGSTGYIWTVPDGVVPTTAMNGTSITVNFTNAFTGTGNICVSAINSCGTGTARCYSVTARPPVAGVISGPSPVCKASIQSYSIATVPGASSYTWSVTGGASYSSSGTTLSVNFNSATSTTATIKVNGLNACGAGQPAQKAVAVNLACRTLESDVTSTNSLVAYPNPARDHIRVVFTQSQKDKVRLQITDVLGHCVYLEDIDSVEGENIRDLDLNGLRNGMYFITLAKDGAEVQRIRFAIE